MLASTAILSRRRMLAAAGAVVTWYAVPPPLRAEAEMAPDGVQTLHARSADAVSGYDGLAQGPLLRIKCGAELRVHLVNELPDATAIHFHGVRTANRVDGLTPSRAAPGTSLDYRFVPPDAGTFWYHAPWMTTAARQHLNGALIVEETVPPDIDREHVLVFDEWPTGPEPGAERSFQILANGGTAPDLAVAANERLRLRLVNAARSRVATVRIERHRVFVMALDGQPAEPFPPRDSRLVLGPGNTADLFVDATLEPGAVAQILWEDTQTTLARLVYAQGTAARSVRPVPPAPLAPNALPARLDFAHALRLDLPLERLAHTQPRELAPLLRAKRGRAVMLALINPAATPRAVHVHGHAFRLLDRLDDGWKPFWLATVLVDAGQTARIAFQADNPGQWLIESVAVEEAGLVTAGWFEVA